MLGKITNEYFEHNPLWVLDVKTSKMMSEAEHEVAHFYDLDHETLNEHNPRLRVFITASDVCNIPGGWNFHIDNADHNTIASFTVTTFEEANHHLSMYGIWLPNDSDVSVVEPDWIGDAVMANTALMVVRRYKRNTNGYPPDLTWEEWHKILNKIIFSLTLTAGTTAIDKAYEWYRAKYGDLTRREWDAFIDRYQEGLQLFGKYFTYLNW